MASVPGIKYNAKHFSASNDYQIQEQNWFEVTVDGYPDLTFLTHSANLPEISNEAVEIPHGNSSAWQAGKRSYSQNQFTILDAIRKDIEAQLLEWQALIYSTADGAMGWVEEYKKTIYITEYGPNGSAARKWVFYGAWPEQISYGSLTGDGAGRKDIQVTFRYDDIDRYQMTTPSLLEGKNVLL